MQQWGENEDIETTAVDNEEKYTLNKKLLL